MHYLYEGKACSPWKVLEATISSLTRLECQALDDVPSPNQPPLLECPHETTLFLEEEVLGVAKASKETPFGQRRPNKMATR